MEVVIVKVRILGLLTLFLVSFSVNGSDAGAGSGRGSFNVSADAGYGYIDLNLNACTYPTLFREALSELENHDKKLYNELMMSLFVSDIKNADRSCVYEEKSELLPGLEDKITKKFKGILVKAKKYPANSFFSKSISIVGLCEAKHFGLHGRVKCFLPLEIKVSR